MVTEQLVELDELGAVLREPVGEPLVQLCPLRLRQGLVGGVAHEEMAEAERILSGEQRPVRADQLLANERGQLGREPRLLGRERLDDAVVEHLALDGAALEHGPLRRVELVEARREERLERRRHLDFAVAGRLHHRRHLLDEERVSARGVQDPFAASQRSSSPRRCSRSISCSASSADERLQPYDAAPAAAAVEQLRPRHAEEQEWYAGRQERDVLEQIEQHVLSPLDVVEDGDERRLGRHRFEQLAERPRDLVRRGRAFALRARTSSASAATGSSSSRDRCGSSCFRPPQQASK